MCILVTRAGSLHNARLCIDLASDTYTAMVNICAQLEDAGPISELRVKQD